jgi:hypothetical protein
MQDQDTKNEGSTVVGKKLRLHISGIVRGVPEIQVEYYYWNANTGFREDYSVEL